MKKSFLLGFTLVTSLTILKAQQHSIHKVSKVKSNLSEENLSGTATININVSELRDKSGRFFLRTMNINDSASANGQTIIFKPKISEPQIAYLMYYPKENLGEDLSKLRVQRKNLYTFYLTTGNTHIVIKDSLQVAEIIHPNSFQIDYKNIESKRRQFELNNMLPLVKDFYTALGKGDQNTAKKLSEKLDALNVEEKETIFKPFIEQQAKSSPVALSILSQYASNGTDPAKVSTLFSLLKDAYKKLPTAVAIQSNIDQQSALKEKDKATQVGQQALDFTQNDTSGHPISLKDFRGKYVLIDFWASWCGPCRNENPNVVQAYQKYHTKNFTILGVSFDQSKESWLSAIRKDGLTWTQVSDLQYWENAVGKIYGIQSIPANILLDPTGKIIAKNIRGEELQGTLANLFGE